MVFIRFRIVSNFALVSSIFSSTKLVWAVGAAGLDGAVAARPESHPTPRRISSRFTEVIQHLLRWNFSGMISGIESADGRIYKL
jgi:hypothetical protein